MAKKSLIAGEYIIEIADNGHVDVLRVFRNAKVTMEEIAKSKNFPVDEKWNTQDLGRHLVKEFGDGKTALFNDITINRFADGKIEIYQECKNVKEALRTIGNQLGFHYEDTWNTQQFGSKLSDYLIEHKEEADKILQTKNARRKKENTEEALNISPAFGISETIIPINSNNMAKFNLTGSKTVAELKKEFNEAFGSRLKVYNKNKIAEDTATLGELGLKTDTEFECRSSRTAGSFIAAFADMGLKVKVYTQDEWVAVLPGLTLEATGKVEKNATRADMEGMEGYQREESGAKEESTFAAADVDMDATYSAIDFGELRLDEEEVIGLYESGKGGNIRKAVNNLIYDLHNEICDFCADEDLTIDLNERGAIYVDNLVENDDNEFGIQFQLPCKFVVVAGGKVVDTFTVEEEPTEIEGYLFTEIPYDYKLKDVEERLEEDCEWIENDMIRLINRTEQDEWMHSLEVGDLGNGLYVKDVDSYLYSVVVGGMVVYSLE